MFSRDLYAEFGRSDLSELFLHQILSVCLRPNHLSIAFLKTPNYMQLNTPSWIIHYTHNVHKKIEHPYGMTFLQHNSISINIYTNIFIELHVCLSMCCYFRKHGVSICTICIYYYCVIMNIIYRELFVFLVELVETFLASC